MAEQKLWFEVEDDFGCMDCGEVEYTQSKTPGLCVECNPSDPRYEKPPET